MRNFLLLKSSLLLYDYIIHNRHVAEFSLSRYVML